MSGAGKKITGGIQPSMFDVTIKASTPAPVVVVISELVTIKDINALCEEYELDWDDFSTRELVRCQSYTVGSQIHNSPILNTIKAELHDLEMRHDVLLRLNLNNQTLMDNARIELGKVVIRYICLNDILHDGG